MLCLNYHVSSLTPKMTKMTKRGQKVTFLGSKSLKNRDFHDFHGFYDISQISRNLLEFWTPLKNQLACQNHTFTTFVKTVKTRISLKPETTGFDPFSTYLSKGSQKGSKKGHFRGQMASKTMILTQKTCFFRPFMHKSQNDPFFVTF
jgi:hypothetical protein